MHILTPLCTGSGIPRFMICGSGRGEVCGHQHVNKLTLKVRRPNGKRRQILDVSGTRRRSIEAEQKQGQQGNKCLFDMDVLACGGYRSLRRLLEDANA